VFWGHDIRLDSFEKPVAEWVSNQFVCTYNCRPDTKEEGCEDMMKMCMYFGCPMFPENDVSIVREEFKKHHFGGMLVHEFDVDKETFQPLAGVTAARYKQKIFLEYRTYVELHIHKEKHMELMEQLLRIRGYDEFTKYDLFAAGGYAMMGIKNYLPNFQEQQQEQGSDISAYFEEFTI
jgi:hypothetical protein